MPLEQRTRKRRSDAGMKRGPRKPLSGLDAPVGIEPVISPSLANVDEMETSAFAFEPRSLKPTADAATEPNVVEEQLAEAHPS